MHRTNHWLHTGDLQNLECPPQLSTATRTSTLCEYQTKWLRYLGQTDVKSSLKRCKKLFFRHTLVIRHNTMLHGGNVECTTAMHRSHSSTCKRQRKAVALCGALRHRIPPSAHRKHDTSRQELSSSHGRRRSWPTQTQGGPKPKCKAFVMIFYSDLWT